MFFFIAGIQPRTVSLEDHPRMCPACGLHQARLKRVDHYVSAFFIPLFRVKAGAPFVQCERCGAVSGDSGDRLPPYAPARPRSCPSCGNPVEAPFRYCPSCGAAL